MPSNEPAETGCPRPETRPVRVAVVFMVLFLVVQLVWHLISDGAGAISAKSLLDAAATAVIAGVIQGLIIWKWPKGGWGSGPRRPR